MKINVIGAGIGGLTAGIALRRHGFEVEIYERAPSFKAVGTGITIAANAMSIFGELGLAETVTAAGHPIEYARIGRADGSALSTLNTKRLSAALGYTSVGIHRADLHEILAEAFGHDHIHCDHELASIASSDRAVTATFTDGSSTHSDLLVGADGLRSKVRQLVFGDSPLRDAGQACWRGVVELSSLNRPDSVDPKVAWELWGHGARMGYLMINTRQIYWYAVLSASFVDFPLEDTGRFRGRFVPMWNESVQDILNSTPNETIIAAPLKDRVPSNVWHTRRVAMLGDAIHPTTPNMGQGACMAIESAWTLAHCLAHEPSPEAAFAWYQDLRAPRTSLVTTRSFRIGGLAHTLSPLKARLRNAVFRAVPVSIQEQAMTKMLSNTPLRALKKRA